MRHWFSARRISPAQAHTRSPRFRLPAPNPHPTHRKPTMLLALSLRDFVIVRQLDLDFQSGFTVLTGETGAGKSITLDALSLLLGGKADYGQVRSGAKEAQLSALFDLSDRPALAEELRAQGLLDEDADELSIRRTIDAKGKSRSYLNGQAATLAQLKQIGASLIDIHGQHAHYALAHEPAQRQLLDAFAGSLKTAEAVSAAYHHWQRAEKALAQAQEQGESLAIERERLQWQYAELEQLNTHEGEWETVAQQHDSLANAAELLQAAGEAQEYISGDNGILSLIARCQRALSPLSDIEPRFAESLEMLESAYAELRETSSNMGDVTDSVEINPAELAAREERMAELMNMARKYRTEPEKLPEKLREIQAALDTLAADTDIAALQQVAAEAHAAYTAAAKQLSAERRAAAERLSAETAARMQSLAMQGAQFRIELLPAEPGAHGLERIEYQVSANKGTPLRPLGKVASGGELARISLAIQTVTSACTDIPTLIFDEVDTGIGGGVAETVGRALRALGRHRQVLAITHLPQVAACGEHHWQVAKHNDGEQTVSEIRVLDEAARTDEIARMLGGETITDTTRRHAAEMLALAAKAA